MQGHQGPLLMRSSGTNNSSKPKPLGSALIQALGPNPCSAPLTETVSSR